MSDLSPGSSSPVRRDSKRKPPANGKPDPMQDLLHALQAMKSGDFSVRMTGDHLGIEGKIADTFNEIVAANQRMAQQLERVGQVVGREGKTRQRVKFDLSSGSCRLISLASTSISSEDENSGFFSVKSSNS